MKTTKLLASALLFAAVFGTAQAADTETLEAMKAMKAQNGSVKTVLMDVFTTPAGNVDRVNIIQSSGNPEIDERAVKSVSKYPYPKRKTASKYQHTVTFETNVEVINN